MTGNGNLRDENCAIFNEDPAGVSENRQNDILITVQSIENVDDSKVKDVTILVEFNDTVLTQSLPIPISQKRADVDLTGVITPKEISPEFINDVLSNPVLFTVMDSSYPMPIQVDALSSSPSLLEKEPKKKASKSSSRISGLKSAASANRVLGICNLDIRKFMAGETRIKEILLLEPDRKVPPTEVLPWMKLPRLEVLATTGGDQPLLPKSAVRMNTIVSLTVESVYNAPEYLSEGGVFDAYIVMPALGNKGNRIGFSNGVVTTTKDFTCRKKWMNLSHLEGPGARSKNKISPSACDIISCLPGVEDLGKLMNASEKTIRWNTWKSSLMYKPDLNSFLSKLIKYRVWPIEIVLPNQSPKEVAQKDKSAKSDKKSKPVPSAPSSVADHFTAFLDFSPLLYPGATKIRVAAPLMTYSAADLAKTFGPDSGTFLRQSITSVATVKSKTSQRSKGSLRENEDSRDSPGQLVVNDNGDPAFIVVEIEFSRPLTPKKDPDLIVKNLKDCLCLKGNINKRKTTSCLIMNDFSQSIVDAVNTIAAEFNEFHKEDQREDDRMKFPTFLSNQKNFSRIKITLQNKMGDLISEKYGKFIDYEKMLPEIYIFLVSEMHRITSQLSLKDELPLPSRYSDLQLYAEEAWEEGEYDNAKNYLYEKLSKNTSNSNYWLDVASFYVKLKSYEEAIEAVREALCLDFHHQIGLVMYALLMEKMSDVKTAEMTLEVLLYKYPDFAEGWTILRFFYLAIDNHEGAVTALKQVKLLASERQEKAKQPPDASGDEEKPFCWSAYMDQDQYQPATEEKYGMGSFKNGLSWAEPLSWTITACPVSNINMRAVVLLQKLGFYEFASMILCREFACKVKDGVPPMPHAYYISVNYYLQAEYEEAVRVLQNFTKEYGQEIYLWSLLGHCFYKLENHPKAISCYEYVIQCYNRPDNLHLIYLRMGNYYLKLNKFPCAKEVLTKGCQYSPTPRMWKGVGIACMMMEEMDLAEVAFTEANYLDNENSETWAYLAITNSVVGRMDLFKNCCNEAKKRGLQNPELIKKLKSCATLNGLSEEELGF